MERATNILLEPHYKLSANSKKVQLTEPQRVQRVTAEIITHLPTFFGDEMQFVSIAGYQVRQLCTYKLGSLVTVNNGMLVEQFWFRSV